MQIIVRERHSFDLAKPRTEHELSFTGGKSTQKPHRATRLTEMFLHAEDILYIFAWVKSLLCEIFDVLIFLIL